MEVDDRGVGTITFFHPASNSLPGHILRKLADTVREAGQRDDVKVVVLKSAGDPRIGINHCAHPGLERLKGCFRITLTKCHRADAGMAPVA